MTNRKTGFVFYFDYYPNLLSLPPEQRGWLITALCVYADRVWREEGVTAEEILEQFPQLSDPAQMAYRFMTNAILRDTQRWLQQRQVRTQRRQQQSGTAPGASKDVSPEEQLRRYQEDMELARRMVEGCKES